MKKYILLFKPIIIALFALSIALLVLCGITSRELFFTGAGIALLTFLYILAQTRYLSKEIREFLSKCGRTLSSAQTDALLKLPMTVFITDEWGEVLWYNEKAARDLPEGQEYYGESISQVIGGIDFRADCPAEGYDISFGGKRYTLFINPSQKDDQKLYAYYMVDDTELKHNSEEYFSTRPAGMIIMIDNYDELVQNAKESEHSQIISEIEYVIEDYVEKHNGRTNKIEKDKFVVVLEKRYAQQMIEDRFALLDKVRSLSKGDFIPTTLSIGVACEAEDIRSAQKTANQALDMALGRGGDQAAVRTANGYEFYGGISKGVEKRTKVKTRIVATALQELIESSDQVILMGHRFADLDAFGSAVGLLKAVRMMGKPGLIAIRRNKNLVMPLYERLLQNGYENSFYEPEEVLEKITPKTLLIIVDTHSERIVESPEIYRACETVVVIDHHRKVVGHIDNAVIFYHEPYASSAAEMVSELVQYFGENVRLGRIEAEALLSGIMLDTKNFVIKTGVRTFEAAAYLRRLGADTVEVRKLFSSSMESYQRRSRMVSSAEIYRGCAISLTNTPAEDVQVLASQAADELLTISKVDASFVLYEVGTGVSCSARSMGQMNVQVIMEKLGGGGHLTMAATQMKDISLENARQRLLEVIDEYRETQKS